MTVRLPVVGDTRFDPSRLRVLTRGAQLLVMDRVSGHWVMLPDEFDGTLRLLAAKPSALPNAVSGRVDSLRSMLIREYVGVSGMERRFSDLSTIIIKLTNACNLACSYCYDFEPTESAKRIELDVAHRAIAEAIDLCKGRLWVILHGGEPMLVWDLIEDIVLQAEHLAAQRSVKVTFSGQTNLTRLDQRIVTFSTEHDLSWGISVDGRPAVHDKFRVTHNGQGSHAAFIRALETYPAFVRRAGIMSTITAANQHLLLDTARYFRDLGMPSWDWSLFQPIGRGRDARPFAIDIDTLLASWEELFDAVVSGEFHGFAVMPVKKYLDVFNNGPGDNMCMRAECGAARDLLSISSDGTIEACDCIDPNGPMGNLGNLAASSLRDARGSATAQAIRSRDVQHRECGECIWFGVCGGSCMAHAGGVDQVWEEGCAMALTAFDRISAELARGQALQEYLRSLDE